MKTKEQIEELLHSEIDNFKSLNGVFLDAVNKGCDINKIKKLSLSIDKSAIRVLAFKEVLNHD